jgi:hypothetical protein
MADNTLAIMSTIGTFFLFYMMFIDGKKRNKPEIISEKHKLAIDEMKEVMGIIVGEAWDAAVIADYPQGEDTLGYNRKKVLDGIDISINENIIKLRSMGFCLTYKMKSQTYELSYSMGIRNGFMCQIEKRIKLHFKTMRQEESMFFNYYYFSSKLSGKRYYANDYLVENKPISVV